MRAGSEDKGGVEGADPLEGPVAPAVAFVVRAAQTGGEDGHVRGRAFRLGERDDAPAPAAADPVEGGQPLSGVRVTEEEHGGGGGRVAEGAQRSFDGEHLHVTASAVILG